MIKLFLPLSLFLLSSGLLAAQTIELVTPIAGEQGRDFVVVNHVDHDTSEGIRDFSCGTKTYDGHQGTDFTLRSFAQMDSGVAILAAADGVVTTVTDTAFDRNKVSVISRGFGNWIEISHGDGWTTYYAHLRTNSALVQPGDTVRAGMPIAQVGSAGNSSDPHLHFEVWRVTSILHDPFGNGECSQERSSLWIDQPDYRTEFAVIDAGLLDWVPTLDTLRERPSAPEKFDAPDTAVTLWVHQEGIEKGDRLKVIWERTVDDALWFEFETEVFERDFWYYYFWSWINLPPNDDYRVRYLHNGQEILRRSFSVGDASSVEDTPDRNRRPLSIRFLAGNWNVLAIEAKNYESPHTITAELYTITGERVAKLLSDHRLTGRYLVDLSKVEVAKGMYVVRISDGKYTIGVPITQ